MFLAFFIGISIGGALCAAEHQKAHDKLFALIGQSCITSPNNEQKTKEIIAFVQKNTIQKLLDLNSRYYVIYPQVPSEPLTALAYACHLVTCDSQVVFELCKMGANPNVKHEFGLYPATCCFQSLERLYPKKDEHAHYVENQMQKLRILNNVVQIDDFVHIGSESEPTDENELKVDWCVKKIMIGDVRDWIRELLKRPFMKLTF